ncbi:hypothetical protein LQZ24_03940 [Fructobacillus sp. M1-13]|uniref:Uncharacterized protein n=1 Tax=Fructobacillus papyriferae TaxID=2713171 RepID=A0ABS5QPP4_9LACO|nr:hypothetical protein [Fructobacillus papyriferae]MBS9335154.1 hypothetical protein [Fructobacillus papyriferae]MCD2159176.1 hypothetical protein [Fructobacillus papyriferae]
MRWFDPSRGNEVKKADRKVCFFCCLEKSGEGFNGNFYTFASLFIIISFFIIGSATLALLRFGKAFDMELAFPWQLPAQVTNGTKLADRADICQHLLYNCLVK